MKTIFVVLSLTTLIIFSNCKSNEQKNEPKQMQRQQYVLPPEKEEPRQPIQKQQNINPKISATIIAVIKENIAATQAKDKERVLNTIAKDSPQLKSTIQGMDYVFANFNMQFELEKVEVIEVTGDDAEVYYIQTTKAVSGKGFTPTRSSGIHHLKKEEGKWKIFKTDYLTNEPIQ